MDDFEKGLVNEVRDALRALIVHHRTLCLACLSQAGCEEVNRAQRALDGAACSL